jgi:multidrug resistance protein, MATE family
MEKSATTGGGSSGGGGEAAEEAKVPLLQPRAAAAAAAAEEDHGGGGDGKAAADEEGRDASWSSLPLRRRAWEENKKLWVVAGPSIFTRFASFGVTVISQAFIGHIGATELAAYALVSTVLMRFSNGILVRVLIYINPFVLDSCSHNSIHAHTRTLSR